MLLLAKPSRSTTNKHPWAHQKEHMTGSEAHSSGPTGKRPDFPLPPSKPMPASCFDFCPRTSQSQSQSTSNGRCPSKSLSWEESKKSYSKLNSTIWCCQKNSLSSMESRGVVIFWRPNPSNFPVFDTHQHLQGVNMFNPPIVYRDPCILVQSESYCILWDIITSLFVTMTSSTY